MYGAFPYCPFIDHPQAGIVERCPSPVLGGFQFWVVSNIEALRLDEKFLSGSGQVSGRGATTGTGKAFPA